MLMHLELNLSACPCFQSQQLLQVSFGCLKPPLKPPLLGTGGPSDDRQAEAREGGPVLCLIQRWRPHTPPPGRGGACPPEARLWGLAGRPSDASPAASPRGVCPQPRSAAILLGLFRPLRRPGPLLDRGAHSRGRPPGCRPARDSTSGRWKPPPGEWERAPGKRDRSAPLPCGTWRPDSRTPSCAAKLAFVLEHVVVVGCLQGGARMEAYAIAVVSSGLPNIHKQGGWGGERTVIFQKIASWIWQCAYRCFHLQPPTASHRYLYSPSSPIRNRCTLQMHCPTAAGPPPQWVLPAAASPLGAALRNWLPS